MTSSGVGYSAWKLLVIGECWKKSLGGLGGESISKLKIENDAIEQLPYYLPGPFGF